MNFLIIEIADWWLHRQAVPFALLPIVSLITLYGTFATVFLVNFYCHRKHLERSVQLFSKFNFYYCHWKHLERSVEIRTTYTTTRYNLHRELIFTFHHLLVWIACAKLFLPSFVLATLTSFPFPTVTIKNNLLRINVKTLLRFRLRYLVRTGIYFVSLIFSTYPITKQRY